MILILNLFIHVRRFEKYSFKINYLIKCLEIFQYIFDTINETFLLGFIILIISMILILNLFIHVHRFINIHKYSFKINYLIMFRNIFLIRFQYFNYFNDSYIILNFFVHVHRFDKYSFKINYN